MCSATQSNTEGQPASRFYGAPAGANGQQQSRPQVVNPLALLAGRTSVVEKPVPQLETVAKSVVAKPDPPYYGSGIWTQAGNALSI